MPDAKVLSYAVSERNCRDRRRKQSIADNPAISFSLQSHIHTASNMADRFPSLDEFDAGRLHYCTQTPTHWMLNCPRSERSTRRCHKLRRPRR